MAPHTNMHSLTNTHTHTTHTHTHTRSDTNTPFQWIVDRGIRWSNLRPGTLVLNHCECQSSLRTSVVVCTDLSGKQPHRQISAGSKVASGSLGCVMVSLLARNARDVGSIPALGIVFHIFIRSRILQRRTTTLLYRDWARWLNWYSTGLSCVRSSVWTHGQRQTKDL